MYTVNIRAYAHNDVRMRNNFMDDEGSTSFGQLNFDEVVDAWDMAWD